MTVLNGSGLSLAGTFLGKDGVSEEEKPAGFFLFELKFAAD